MNARRQKASPVKGGLDFTFLERVKGMEFLFLVFLHTL